MCSVALLVLRVIVGFLLSAVWPVLKFMSVGFKAQGPLSLTLVSHEVISGSDLEALTKATTQLNQGYINILSIGIAAS